MYILEDKFYANVDQQRWLDFFKSSDFPFFYTTVYPDRDFFKMFCHSLMKRNPDNEHLGGIVNSPFYEIAESFLLEICKQNNLDLNVVYRASVNGSFHYDVNHTFIHVDHEFDHKVFLLYLNTCKGDTILFNSHDQIIKTITPEKNKYVIFDGNIRHASSFCEQGDCRFVLAMTFN